MSYDLVVREMIERIYKEDYENQVDYLKFAIDKVRRNQTLDINVLLDMKVFFVPSEDYLAKFTNVISRDPQHNIYDTTGKCVWTGYLVFPVYDVGGGIRGFCGYDILRAIHVMDGDETAEDWAKYKYSIDTVMKRGDFFLAPPGMYDQCVEEGYVVLTDGVFDMINLVSLGYNSICLMGSFVSDIMLFTLKFIPKKIIAEDNDRAGVDLGRQLKQKLKGVVSLRQNTQSDTHDIINSDMRQEYLKALDQSIEYGVGFTLRTKA